MVQNNIGIIIFIILCLSLVCCTKDGVDETTSNTAPQITSEGAVHATGGIYFCYRATFLDPDGPVDSVRFENYASWLSTDADSLFGAPGDGLSDTGFMVIVSDASLADTLSVTVTMIPCIVVYGDTRTGHDYHQQIVDLIVARKPSTVFHTGDLVNNGNNPDDWVTFNDIVSELVTASEFFPAPGNHEHQSQLFFDNFNLPNNEQWYSVERNSMHFIILNSCVATGPGSEQYHWLESDLAGIDDSIKFVAAVFHHPPYSTGPHTEDEMGLRETFVPLFRQYGVDLVFNGHDHCYERSLCDGVYYIVSGGGGAPLYDQSRDHPCSQMYLKEYHYCKLSTIGDKLVVKVYDIESRLIDQFEINQ